MHQKLQKRLAKSKREIKHMKITESKLRQIILEEIRMVELEEFLITEAAKLGIVLTEEQKKSIMQRLKKKAGQYGAGLALGSALAVGGAGLHGLQSDYQQGVRDQISQNVAAAEEYNSSYEGTLDRVRTQLNNTAAWLWSMSPDSKKIEILPTTETGAGILPPEFSVMKQVYDDFMAGAGPSVTPDMTSAPSGDHTENRINFLDDFEDKDFEGYGGGRGIRGAIYLDFTDLPSDYALPLTDQSPSEYYVQLWDQYIGY